MNQLAALKKDRINSRTITVESYVVDHERVVVEGVLFDQRHVAIISTEGKPLEPGPVHRMIVRLLVSGTPPCIQDAEAEMATYPMESCPEALNSIKEIIGLPIVYGYSREVKRRMGGTHGCLHLTALVVAMGPAALQGWNLNHRRSEPPAEARSLMLQYIKNSCHVWREDGPTFQRALREEAKANGRS